MIAVHCSLQWEILFGDGHQSITLW
jgi:hypothetical protein